MNIFLTVLDCIKILFQAFRHGIVNIPVENSNSAAIKVIGVPVVMISSSGMNTPNGRF